VSPGTIATMSADLLGRGHAGDDFVDVVDLLVACFREDVLSRGVLRCGQLGAPDDPLVEVVVGDDGGLVPKRDINA
jgi:hypothetical protein